MGRRGRPLALPGRWLELAQACGGLSELADACLVTPRTIQRWARGLRPREVQRIHVDRLARSLSLSSPWD
jgi:hypothetical protein